MLRRSLAGLLLCILTGTLAAQNPRQFLVAPEYTTGNATNPQAAVTGDFNGDGNLDIAVANSNTNTVSIFLGKGDGTFAAHVDYATGGKPLGVVAGNFGNGHLDLAVTNSTSNTVSVLLGNGDGTFQGKTDYATGNGPQGIAIGHFSASSSNVDYLAVTNATDGTVGILFANGNGTFNPVTASTTYRTGFNPTSVAVADFNLDGIPDLVVANNNNNNVVSVLLGLGTGGVGNGTFGTQLQYATGANPVAVAVADFNGDGNPDIVVANQQGNTISILLGNGTKGGFAAHVDYATAAFPTGIAVGDFNSDGHTDVAVSAGNGNTVSVLWGHGDGTMLGQVNAGTGDIPYGVVAGDFNNDGITDLATADSGDNSVTIILSNGTSETFQARADYPAGATPFSIVKADFNGDGVSDLAVTNTGTASAISVLLGNGNGTFQGPNHFSTETSANSPTDPYGLAVGNFTGNNVPDLAVTNYGTGTVGIMLGVEINGEGTGTFQSDNTFPVGSEPASVAVGDVNGDGIEDLVVANFHSNNVSVLLGNGDGTFKTAVDYPVGNGPIAVALYALTGNKIQDIVVVNETDSSASVLLGNGNGTFQAQVAYPTGPGGNPLGVAVQDFNGDGIPDLAVADFLTQQVSILLGNGDGTFQSPKTYGTGNANPSSIVVADFNGDGKWDLALTSTPSGLYPGNLVILLLGNGDGTFQAPSLYGVGSLAYSAVVGDFNGDGALDLAVANGRAGSVSVLLNQSGTAITIGSSGNPAPYGQSVALRATVAASVSNGTGPTGTVTIKNGNTVIGRPGTLVGGVYTVNTATLPVGSNNLSVIYSGDANYQAHTISYTQNISQAGTTTQVGSSGSPSVPSQAVTFTATVNPNTSGVPTGTVTFSDGGTAIGTVSVALVSGKAQASLTTSTLAVGTHTIAAVYNGDVNFTTSSSSTLSQVVGQASTTTALSGVTAANLGQNLTFTATVTSSIGGTPTGSVNFFDSGKQIGTGTLNAGVATFSTSSLTAGTHTITGTYSGDSTYVTSTSADVIVVVTAPDFKISSSNLSPGSVAPGASATSTVTITPLGGLNPTSVELSCSVTPAANPAATCSLGAITATNNVGSAKLTVSTVGPTAALNTPAGQKGSGTVFAFAIMVPAMLLGGAGINKPSRRKLLGFCLIFLVLSGCAFQVACGGGGSTPTPTGNSGTPANTYSVTITGNANGIQHTASPVSLTVN